MKEKLMNLDITEAEAKLLERLLHNQPSTATQMMELSGYHRKMVYDILTRLENRTLIISQKEGKERLFWFAGNASIDAIIEEKKNTLKETITQLQELKQEITKLPVSEHVEAYSLVGTQAVRHVFSKIVNLKSNYVALGGPQSSENIMGETFWLNFHQKQKANDVRARAVFNPSMKQSRQKYLTLDIRYFELIEPLSEIIVCADHVITIVWTQSPRVHIVKSQQYANSQKEYFELIWEKAEK